MTGESVLPLATDTPDLEESGLGPGDRGDDGRTVVIEERGFDVAAGILDVRGVVVARAEKQERRPEQSHHE